MNREEKIQLAKQQYAKNMKCDPSVFDQDKNVFLQSEDTFFEILTFGINAVIWADKSIIDWCRDKFASTPARYLIYGDNFIAINDKLRSFGKKLVGEHSRYLHLFPEKTVGRPKNFSYRLFRGGEIKELKEQELDYAFDYVLDSEEINIALAAYDNDEIAAIAGADDYKNIIWPIGIDTAPKYRNRGLGAYLTKELTLQIEKDGMIPTFCIWSAHIAATRVALSAGYYPAYMGYWAERQ